MNHDRPAGINGTAQAEGTPLHIVRHGAGPRWFLGLHGLAGTAEALEPVVQYLPEDVSFFAIDLPGYGRSTAPAQWTAAGVVQAIVEGLAAAHLQPPSGEWIVIGNCSGAILAAALRQTRPEVFVDLRMVEPFAYLPVYLDCFTWPFAGPLFFYSTFHTSLGRWLTNRGLRDVGEADVDKTSGFENSERSVPVRYLRLLKALGGAEAFRASAGPTHIVHGACSFDDIHRSVARWSAVWPGTVVTTLASAGHLPFQENPEALARALFSERMGGLERE
ncbi:MAG: pimeloyl-ACP methyl ester carboxylesterase [Flavobacteriales bacterium]|jgi:pimeloyl-ACP methyl ester carboxylesterase